MTSPGYRPEESLIPPTPGITPLNDVINGPFHQDTPVVYTVSPPTEDVDQLMGGSGNTPNSNRPDLPDWRPGLGGRETGPGYHPEQGLIPPTPPVKAAFPGRQASPSVPQSQLPPLNRAQGV